MHTKINNRSQICIDPFFRSHVVADRKGIKAVADDVGRVNGCLFRTLEHYAYGTITNDSEGSLETYNVFAKSCTRSSLLLSRSPNRLGLIALFTAYQTFICYLAGPPCVNKFRGHTIESDEI